MRATTSCPPGPAPPIYLGEVSIDVEGAEGRNAPIRLGDRVVGLSFRKPGEGLRPAVTVLVALGGHQLVFDTSGDALVVGPDDALDDSWLW